MSALIETYALACGVPIDEPYMNECYFPTDTPLEKVVLVHAFAGAIQDQNGKKTAAFPAKIYDYYQEVIDILKPILDPLGYKFYQIGGSGEPALNGTEYFCGKTTIPQCNFLVKRAALLIGNDSMWAHVRGAAEKPLVILYGSTSQPHFPYWRNIKKSFLIESHRCGNKPSYSSNENPKTINFITPEEVVSKSLKALDIDKSIKRNSFYIGTDYLSPLIELIPKSVIHPSLNINAPIVVRMDYFFDEANLIHNLSLRKLLIITNKEIDLKLLSSYKENIISLKIEIDNVSPQWINAVKKIGIKSIFFSTEKDEKKLKKMRLDYYDSCFFDRFTPASKEDFLKASSTYLNKKLDETLDFSNLKFKTKKVILSDGKIYLSKAHWKIGKSSESTENNVSNIIDHSDFWEDVSHYYIFAE